MTKPANHEMHRSTASGVFQMEITLAVLGDLGRSLDEGLIRTQADCFVQNSGRCLLYTSDAADE